MSNLDYCMFQNTLQDLRDCEERLSEWNLEDLSIDEANACMKLIKLCWSIYRDYQDEIAYEKTEKEETDEFWMTAEQKETYQEQRAEANE